MKQIKRFLCSIILTSLVLFGSVNVFAKGVDEETPPSETVVTTAGEGVGKALEQCQKNITGTAVEVGEATNYTSEGNYTSNDKSLGETFGVEVKYEQPPHIGPDIIYVTVENSTDAWEEANCDESNEEVEYRCTIMAPSNSEPLIDGKRAGDSGIPDIEEKYNYCKEIKYGITYGPVTLIYPGPDEPNDCTSTCAVDCKIDHGTHPTTEELENQYVTKWTYDVTYSDGKYYAYVGNSDRFNKKNFDDKIAQLGLQVDAEYDGSSREDAENQMEEDANNASAAAYKLIGEDIVSVAEKSYFYSENLWGAVGMGETVAKQSTFFMGSGATYAEALQNAQEECYYNARYEIINGILAELKDKGYTSLIDSNNNIQVYNGCRIYEITKDAFSGKLNGGLDKIDNSTLTENYQYYDLLVQENNRYAALMPIKQLLWSSPNRKWSSSYRNTILGVPTTDRIWDDAWSPKEIEFQEKIVYAEAKKDADKNIEIVRDNSSVDLFIENKTNPQSKYYGKLNPFPLNPDYGINLFNAIRAKDDTPLVYANPTVGAYGFSFAVNSLESALFTSSKSDLYGTNLIEGYPYADIYMQKVFGIKETKNLIAYAVEDIPTLWNAGDPIGIQVTPVSDECGVTYRALFNVYGENGFHNVNTIVTSTNMGMAESHMITDDAIYGTVNNHGKEIESNDTNTYNGKEVILDVYTLVENAYGDIETAFDDVTLEQSMYVLLTDANGGPRNAFITNSEDAPTIGFKNGLNPVDYKNVPDIVKPSYTNGKTSITKYSILTNGIYCKAQAPLNETFRDEYIVEYNTTTSSSTTSTTKIVQYTICVGQHHCDCEDINVLCECQEEMLGCPQPETCEDNPTKEGCVPSTNCLENPDDPNCGCFDGVDGNCHCPEDLAARFDKKNKKCQIWDVYPKFKPDPDCVEKGIPCTAGNPEDAGPGGICGEGSEICFDKLYTPSSTITN